MEPPQEIMRLTDFQNLLLLKGVRQKALGPDVGKEGNLGWSFLPAKEPSGHSGYHSGELPEPKGCHI